MSNKNGYLAWTGQNATTGNPHHITGRYSMYGNLCWFPTRKERDQYVEDYHSRSNPYMYAVAVDRKTAKAKYCAGMSQTDFDYMVEMCEFMYYEGF